MTLIHNKWMNYAILLANRSKGITGKNPPVGCVIVKNDIVLSTGSTSTSGRPHAEENAIMHAARIGISLKGTTAYVTWPPCSRCTRSLIQAGVTEVIFPKDLDIPERWQKDFDIASGMMNEAGIIVRTA